MSVEEIDDLIRKESTNSAKAPTEFLEAELRRYLNRNAVVYGDGYLSSLQDWKLPSLRETLESEYQCYFEPKRFIKELKKFRADPSWGWKSTYAGCNGQIEYFLEKNGFEEIFQHLWEKGIEKGMKKLEEEDFFMPLPNSPTDILRRYFIGIGYFYPRRHSTIKIHPNFLFAQLGTSTTYGNMDSSFLTRDLIRCPYHETQNGMTQESLSNQELWDYWKDLVALSIGRLPEYIHYGRNDFRQQKKKRKTLKKHLELGRKFVPQRYVELEPQIEKFEWTFSTSNQS